jgi:hypothetical protein
MIPISIIVKILQETGLIDYVGMALSPIMSPLGLPQEIGLVWASTLIANIYGGLIALFSLHLATPLTTAQLSVLSLIMLIAHTFPIELTVAKKSGCKFWYAFLLRASMAYLAGFLLNLIYTSFDYLTEVPTSVHILNNTHSDSLANWAINEGKNYLYIFLIITTLIIILDVLKRIKVIDFINKLLSPVLRLLGIDSDVIPITVVGLTMGLAYGGGLIINEVNNGKLKQRSVFYAMSLLCLCHSLIEDSLLMISIGGHYTGVFIFRICFALIMIRLLVLFTRNISEEKMQRVFYSLNKTKKL